MIYTNIILSNGDVVEMEQVNGGHYMMASMRNIENLQNPIIMAFAVICEACKVNGEKMTMKYIEKTVQCDITLLLETLNSQSINVKGL